MITTKGRRAAASDTSSSHDFHPMTHLTAFEKRKLQELDSLQKRLSLPPRPPGPFNIYLQQLSEYGVVSCADSKYFRQPFERLSENKVF